MDNKRGFTSLFLFLTYQVLYLGYKKVRDGNCLIIITKKMSRGNVQIQRAKGHDTGLIYIDLAGVARIVHKKFVDFGALPDTTSKDVAHGIVGLDTEYAYAELVSHDGTNGIKVAADLDDTNVSITTAGDESGFTETIAEITYIKV